MGPFAKSLIWLDLHILFAILTSRTGQSSELRSLFLFGVRQAEGRQEFRILMFIFACLLRLYRCAVFPLRRNF